MITTKLLGREGGVWRDKGREGGRKRGRKEPETEATMEKDSHQPKIGGEGYKTK